MGSDPEKLFPYEKMLDHLHKFGRFGLVLSTVLLPMITSDIGNGVDYDALADAATKGQDTTANSDDFVSDTSHKRLMERLRDVIIDMVRLEYI